MCVPLLPSFSTRRSLSVNTWAVRSSFKLCCILSTLLCSRLYDCLHLNATSYTDCGVCPPPSYYYYISSRNKSEFLNFIQNIVKSFRTKLEFCLAIIFCRNFTHFFIMKVSSEYFFNLILSICIINRGLKLKKIEKSKIWLFNTFQ